LNSKILSIIKYIQIIHSKTYKAFLSSFEDKIKTVTPLTSLTGPVGSNWIDNPKTSSSIVNTDILNKCSKSIHH